MRERAFEERRQRRASNEVDDDPGLVHRIHSFTIRDAAAAARANVSFIEVSLEGQGRVDRRPTKRCLLRRDNAYEADGSVAAKRFCLVLAIALLA